MPRLTLPLRLWMILSHLIVLALPALAFVGTGTLARELQMQVKGDLIHQGAATAHLVAPMMATDRAALGTALTGIETDTRTRVWLLDAQGSVIASSHRDELGQAMGARDDVAQALQGQQVGQMTTGPDGRLLHMVVATPIIQNADVIGVVLESKAPRDVLHALFFVTPGLSWGVLLALAITLALSVGSGHMLSRSLRRLSRASRRLAEGAFDAVAELDRPGRSHVVEVRELSRDMARMSRRLEERLAYISEFAGNVSHEFKTPITTLRGSVELIRDDAQMPAEQRARFLDNALAELQRMERLVSGLLALARAEEHGTRTQVDLDGVLQAVVSRHPGLQAEGQAGATSGHRPQIETALDNLVHNALHHGGEDVSVQIRAWISEDRVGFDVIDDGAGISEANLPQIFDRFFTTDRASGGVGLGLALVRAICRSHGGDVTVQSRPGHTVFRMILPRAEARSAP